MLTDYIYLDEIDCPYCDRSTYIEHWEIAVNCDKNKTTLVECDECRKSFYVKTNLSFEILPINGE